MSNAIKDIVKKTIKKINSNLDNLEDSEIENYISTQLNKAFSEIDRDNLNALRNAFSLYLHPDKMEVSNNKLYMYLKQRDKVNIPSQVLNKIYNEKSAKKLFFPNFFEFIYNLIADSDYIWILLTPVFENYFNDWMYNKSPAIYKGIVCIFFSLFLVPLVLVGLLVWSIFEICCFIPKLVIFLCSVLIFSADELGEAYIQLSQGKILGISFFASFITTKSNHFVAQVALAPIILVASLLRDFASVINGFYNLVFSTSILLVYILMIEVTNAPLYATRAWDFIFHYPLNEDTDEIPVKGNTLYLTTDKTRSYEPKSPVIAPVHYYLFNHVETQESTKIVKNNDYGFVD